MLGRFSRGALVLAVMGVLVAPAAAQERSGAHIVPFFPTASDARPMGLVRVVNLSDESGTVDIVATDAAGQRFDDVSLAIGAHETVHFDADDLEMGNADVGLTGGTGAGQGDWRLELTGELDIEVQAYVRTPAGAFAEMYETGAGDGERFRIPTFNPGENAHQVGLLWLFNPGDESVTATVQGTDDLGQSPGPGVSIELPAGEARTYTAAELESGAARGLTGSLGDGVGKWRLAGEASSPVRAMSLISSPTGHLTNLSTVPAHASGGIHRVPLFPPASEPLGRQGFARVVNRSDRAGAVRVEAFDETEWLYEALTLTLEARETRHFNSDDLELGNPVKGLTGSTGAGRGDWRLELTSDLDIEVLSYVRMLGGQGYVTPMHDTSAQESDGLMRYYVPIFHGADYEGQESRLHLLNLGESDVRVGIAGLDDAGAAPPAGDVSLVLGPGETRVVTSGQLEDGGQGLDGRFGSGEGRWRLFVSSQEALQVMSLGYSADGFLANLSRGSPPASDVPVVAPVVAPDLVVEIPSVSDGAPEAGQTFTLSARVRNRGDGDAGATTLRYYRSANANVSASDLEVGNDRVNALSASQSSGASLTLNAPEDPGTYYYGACADVVPDESDTTNNCSAGLPVTVSEPGASNAPDLVVSVSVDNDTPDAGGEFELTATVRNVGDGASSSTTLRYYRSPDATITTADTEQGIDAMHALSASQSSGASLTLNAPEDPGTYYYGACADAVPDESDTTDNCSAGLAVAVSEPGASNAPDLVVSVSVDNDTPDAGGEFELTATVRNVGDGASASTTLRYYRSRDATITTADTEQGIDAMHALSASESSRASLTLNAPEDPGTYYYGACADAVPDESDTTDNCSAGLAITVSEPVLDPPDLVVSVSVDNDTPDAGREFELTATVRNVGDGASAATMLHYYRSSDATISAADIRLGTHSVDALDASGMSTGSIARKVPTSAGTDYYGACVDAVPNESDTTNNCSAAVAVTPQSLGPPDLVVGVTAGSDISGLRPGHSLTVNARVTNVGDGPSALTTLRYYWSTDDTITTSDTEQATDSVSVLPTNGSSAASAELTAPSEPGTHYFGACVDAVPDESDTTNNCSPALAATVNPPRPPDLGIWAMSSHCNTHWYGEDAELRGRVSNWGETRSPPSTRRFYLHSGNPSAKVQVATREVKSLAKRFTEPWWEGSQDDVVEVPVPTTLGRYTQIQCVDVVDGETNTGNNCASKLAFDVVNVTHMGNLDLTVPEQCSLEAKFCLNTGEYGHWGPRMGGVVRFKLNGSAILSTEETGAQVCTTAAVNVGSNSMQVEVVQVSGEQRLCPPSGSLTVRGTSAVSSGWYIPLDSSTTSTLNVSTGDAGTCPE